MMRDEQTTQHLSTEALDGLLIDFTDDELVAERAHLQTCAACTVRLEQERSSLAGFASRTHELAEETMSRWAIRPPVVPVHTSWRVRRFALSPAPLAGLAAAAAVILIAISVSFGLHGAFSASPAQAVARTSVAAQQMSHARELASEAAAKPVPAHSRATDEALLESVDRELSRSVAGPLEPLSDPLETQTSASAGQQN